MNLVTRLKRAIGLDSPALAIREVAEPLRAGGELRATIVIAAGEHEARLDHLELRLDEERLIYSAPLAGKFDFWRQVGGFSLPLSGRVLAPGESLSLPVTLGLPATLEPSEAHRRYRLTARLGGLGPRHGVVVAVVE